MFSSLSTFFRALFSNVASSHRELPSLEKEARRAGLNNRPNQTLESIIAEHSDNYELIVALQKANNAGLLTPANALANFIALSEHRQLSWVSQALSNILIFANRPDKLALLSAHQNLADLSLNLSVAYDLGLLTHDANFFAISTHEDLPSLFYILSKIFSADRLAQREFEANREINAVRNYLTRDQVNRPNSHYESPAPMVHPTSIFAPLHRQANFNLILTVVARRDVILALQGLEKQMITENLLQQLLRIAREAGQDPSEAGRQIIAHINRFQANPLAMQAINSGPVILSAFDQRAVKLMLNINTHAVSVHISATNSAYRLKNRYGIGLKIDDELKEMERWLSRIKPNSTVTEYEIGPEYEIGLSRKHFKRLAYQMTGLYTDPKSSVSLRELLALMWLAFKNKDRLLISNPEDARRQLIAALVEMEDSMGDPICPAGAFNKLIEKGCSLHPDIEMVFIDATVVGMKLPVIVREKAIEYLNSNCPAEDLLRHLEEIRAIENAYSVEPIWMHIKEAVIKAILDDFAPLFHSDESSFGASVTREGAMIQFPANRALAETFVAPGIDVALSEDILSTLEKRLSSVNPRGNRSL